MTRGTVEVDGVVCAYEQIGSGPAVILLHGWAQAGKTWSSSASVLGEHFTLYILDLPGFGESDTPQAAWTVETYADFVNKFAVTLQVAPCAIIGHSFGARIALTYASRFPIKKIVLISMGPIGEHSLFRFACIALAHIFHRKRYLAAHTRGDSSLFSKIRSSVLFVYASADALAPAHYGKHMATRIPNAQCVVIPHRGHFVFRDKKGEFLHAVRHFLQTD